MERHLTRHERNPDFDQGLRITQRCPETPLLTTTTQTGGPNAPCSRAGHPVELLYWGPRCPSPWPAGAWGFEEGAGYGAGSCFLTALASDYPPLRMTPKKTTPLPRGLQRRNPLLLHARRPLGRTHTPPKPPDRHLPTPGNPRPASLSRADVREALPRPCAPGAAPDPLPYRRRPPGAAPAAPRQTPDPPTSGKTHGTPPGSATPGGPPTPGSPPAAALPAGPRPGRWGGAGPSPPPPLPPRQAQRNRGKGPELPLRGIGRAALWEAESRPPPHYGSRHAPRCRGHRPSPLPSAPRAAGGACREL